VILSTKRFDRSLFFLMFLKSVLQREEVSKSFTPNRSPIAFVRPILGQLGKTSCVVEEIVSYYW
jgi:hypothetical protein